MRLDREIRVVEVQAATGEPMASASIPARLIQWKRRRLLSKRDKLIIAPVPPQKEFRRGKTPIRMIPPTNLFFGPIF